MVATVTPAEKRLCQAHCSDLYILRVPIIGQIIDRRLYLVDDENVTAIYLRNTTNFPPRFLANNPKMLKI
jgi:hypothetical protein